MKIICVSFLHLDELPPMMSVLKVLSKKYNVLYIGVDEYSDYYKRLFGNNVKFIEIFENKETTGNNFVKKCKRYSQRKINEFRFKNVNRIINENYCENDILWIHHEYTLMHLKKIDIPYYLTMYELPLALFMKKNELKNRVKLAKKVIVPEYTRACMVKACTNLDMMPLIVPNKPYEYENDAIILENNPIDEIVNYAHNKKKKVILYSGIFLRERKLDTIIEATVRLKDKFEIVFIGRKSEYLDELLLKYPHVKYLGFFNPPHHLAIIEKADIGILTYVSDSESINPVFCAPNKIWEYARFGIPMICNNIPGLKFTVEYNKCGYCCDIDSVDDICKTLNKIYNNYEELSKNAIKYYNTIDIENDILKVVDVDD